VVERPDGGEHALASEVLGDPSAAGGPVPWVLLAVKAHQTAGAADWLGALCGPDTTVAVLQNGVEQRALVGPLAGDATVLPTVVWCPSETVAPGRVQQRGEAQLTVPDEPVGVALGELFDGGGATVLPVADFATEAWRKLVLNAVAGLMAITRRRVEVFATDGIG
jgi:2-dehydropantoate 2-reductase